MIVCVIWTVSKFCFHNFIQWQIRGLNGHIPMAHF